MFLLIIVWRNYVFAQQKKGFIWNSRNKNCTWLSKIKTINQSRCHILLIMSRFPIQTPLRLELISTNRLLFSHFIRNKVRKQAVNFSPFFFFFEVFIIMLGCTKICCNKTALSGEYLTWANMSSSRLCLVTLESFSIVRAPQSSAIQLSSLYPP